MLIERNIYPFSKLVYKKHNPDKIIIGSTIIRSMCLFKLPLSFGGRTTLKAYEIGAPAAIN